MKKIILCLFLTFSFTFSLAQIVSTNNQYRGTIKVKKIRSDKDHTKPVLKKKPGIRMYWGIYNGSDYKETFPVSYQSKLFPLIFNRGGLILADENKQWSNNTIMGYDYEIFIGNATAFNAKSASAWDLNQCLRSLSRGQYVWIMGLYYSDAQGIIHRNEIGEFKVERIN